MRGGPRQRESITITVRSHAFGRVAEATGVHGQARFGQPATRRADGLLPPVELDEPQRPRALTNGPAPSGTTLATARFRAVSARTVWPSSHRSDRATRARRHLATQMTIAAAGTSKAVGPDQFCIYTPLAYCVIGNNRRLSTWIESCMLVTRFRRVEIGLLTVIAIRGRAVKGPSLADHLMPDATCLSNPRVCDGPLSDVRYEGSPRRGPAIASRRAHS